jgi:MFS transporter, DHA1 family, staphyloferrin A biosynthesis exporter
MSTTHRSEEQAPRVSPLAVLNPARWGSTFTSLKEADYAWYFAGNIAFFMGMQMQIILRGYLAYDITGRALALALVSLAMAFPMLVVAPFGGVVADRVNKRTLLIVTQSVAAIASLVIALLILADAIAFWHLVAVSLVTGVVFSFNMPARQALVPNLVPQHKLMNAVSLQMGGMNLTRIIAPTGGALLIAPIGIGWVYMLTTFMFILAVSSELHLPKQGMVSNRDRKGIKDELGAGFRYILDDPTLRLLMLVALLMPLFAFPVQQLFPIFARDVFGDGGDEQAAVYLGYLAAASGLGGMVGAMVAANMDRIAAKGRIMLFGGIAMGLALFAFSWSPGLLMGLFFIAAMGVGQMIFMATNNTVIQAGLPSEIRGRVMSILMMSFGMMPLGVLPVSIAADAAGPRWALGGSAVVMLVTILVLWTISARLRGLRVEQLAESELSPLQAAQLAAAGKITQDEADELSGERSRRASIAARRRAERGDESG